MSKKIVGIVGTGPAGLMAGTVLVEHGLEVVFFDHKKAPGRKFLVAGNGGFNITNSEETLHFIEKYSNETIKSAVAAFSNSDFRTFLAKIGIETYVGSSGKIFPKKGIKPIEVLSNWKEYLIAKGAIFKMSHKLIDFMEHELVFESNKNEVTFKCDFSVLACGGGSWAKTGSDGSWLSLFEKKQINCAPFYPSNSGFVVRDFLDMKEYEGSSIKNCKVISKSFEKMGDLVITSYGLEGAPIYAANKFYRNEEPIYIDFKADCTLDVVLSKLQKCKSPTDGLKSLKISKGGIALIKKSMTRDAFLNTQLLADKVKKYKIEIDGLRPIDEVISTIGGLNITEINSDFQLLKMNSVYCVGEMLDWDAPTGGYLIQGCVSSGFIAGNAIANQS